jgi:REP element-mobilizing transposase RayT
VVAVGAPHHVTQRGNNRQKTFLYASDCRFYLALLASQSRRHGLGILGYCFSLSDAQPPNHVHLIVVPQRPDSLARALWAKRGRSPFKTFRFSHPAGILGGANTRPGHCVSLALAGANLPQ